MKNILIDTCSWIDLLSEDENKLLPHLEFWKNNNCINIITNKIIVDEWNKHKELQKKIFSERAKTKYKHAKEIIKKEKLIIPDLEPRNENIENQIALIDKLISESIHLEADTKIKAYISDKNIAGKAPFHNKNSPKDAYIIYTALNYFEELNKEFIFISSNKSDFGNPSNLETEIHPEIIEDFPNAKINYFNDIGRAINHLKNDLPISMVSANESDIIDNEKSDKISIDKSKPILDQVFDYISIMHKEISFVPINIFIKNYPFKNTPNSYPYYSIFNVSTDNLEFFNLLKSIKVTNDNILEIENYTYFDNVVDYENKIKKILISFSQNLIFNVSSEDSREQISIRYSIDKNCDCPKCSFNKFMFVNCFNNLTEYNDDLNDLVELGYLNYKIGNYINSANILREAYSKSKELKYNIKAFLIKFNLQKLSIFIRNNYFGENSKDELLIELKKIKLSEEINRLGTNENLNILEFIKNNDFYTNARNEIQKTTSKIIDSYYSQLNGGWSSNSYIGSLINEFAALETFLSSNYIIYDKFTEFKEVSQIFIEGLFASHSINEESSRLEYFDDWMIQQILYYGNADDINKFYKRYKLKKIKYKKTSETGDSFIDLIDNFFTKNNLLRETFLEKCEDTNRKFWSHYSSVFNNILTLVSICDFEKDFYNSFSSKLFDYLKNENFLQETNIRYVKTFLYRSGKEIDFNLISKFLKNSLNNYKYHNYDFFESIADCVKSKNKKINFSKSDLKKILNIGFEKCKNCEENHPSKIIIPIYSIISNDNYKKEIRLKINESLKSNFNNDLFYLATILDVIEFDKCFFDKSLEHSIPINKKLSLKTVFLGQRKNRNDSLNNLLNLCFKYSIELGTKEIKKIKKIDNYYDWLLDMENFDYSKFKYTWIGEYATRFYFKRIANSKKAKEILNSLIQNNYDSELENDYLNIFIRKTWARKEQ